MRVTKVGAQPTSALGYCPQNAEVGESLGYCPQNAPDAGRGEDVMPRGARGFGAGLRAGV